MAKRTKRQTTVLELPAQYRIRIGQDRDGKARMLGYASGGDYQPSGEWRAIAETFEVDVGRPFRFHVPSNGKGPSGFVFEGFTGENAEPWSPGQVLAAARYKMFGFTLA